MSTDYLIGAIDAGTTSTRMMIFDALGQVVCMSRAHVSLHCPRDGWAEHDPEEVLMTVGKCMEECATQLSRMGKLELVKAVGLAVHRESTVAFDAESGQSLSPMILWMDTRTRDLVKSTSQFSNIVKTKSGLIPSTYFSAFKMRWILDNNTRAANARFATADTWILKHLTGEYKTDVTNASRTMLMNLSDKSYDDYLLDLFAIKREQLPNICESNHDFGQIQKGPFAGVHITAVMGDQQASMLGQNCIKEGDAKCTLGTGAFILVNTGEKITEMEELIATVAGNGKYAIEAPIATAGSGANWIKSICGKSTDITKSDGVLFIPALSGLLAPHWKPDMTGSFLNLTLNTTKENMMAAVFESIAFSVADCLKLINAEIPLRSIQVDGGLSNDERLLQMIADCSEMTLETSDTKECTALGVAMAAAATIGLSIADETKSHITIAPKENPQLLETYRKWRKAMNEAIKSHQQIDSD